MKFSIKNDADSLDAKYPVGGFLHGLVIGSLIGRWLVILYGKPGFPSDKIYYPIMFVLLILAFVLFERRALRAQSRIDYWRDRKNKIADIADQALRGWKNTADQWKADDEAMRKQFKKVVDEASEANRQYREKVISELEKEGIIILPSKSTMN